MAETIYIVRRDEQDQYVRLLNLADSATIYALRDTFRPTYAGRQQTTVQAESRGGAATMVAERRETATVGGTFMVKGSTADAALAQAEALLAQADEAGRDRFVWWQPDGATYPTLCPLLGPATVSVNYTWAQFVSGFFPVEVSWPTQPWTEEQVLSFSDDFRNRDQASALAQFQVDYTTTTTPTSVAQGALELPSGFSSKITHRGRRMWQDGWVTIKGRAKTGAASTDHMVTPGVRYTADTDPFWWATLNGGTLRVYEGTTPTLRASVAQAAPAAGTDYWLRIRAEGSSVTAEYWATQPSPGGTPTNSVTYTNAATLRSGYPALKSWGPSAGATNIPVLAGWEVRPFSYRLLNTPTTVALPQLPGSKDAAVDVELTPPQSDSTDAYHLLLGWRRVLPGTANALGTTFTKSLLIPGEEGLAESGTTAVATDATKYRGASGQARSYTTAATAGEARAFWYFDPTIFEPDDFASTVDLAVFVRYWRDTTIVAPRLRASFASFSDSGTTGTATPEFATTGRYLPTQGAAGVRSTYLGTGTVPVLPELMQLELTLAWSAGSAAAAAFAVDEIYLVPHASLALGATGKNRDDGTYPMALPRARTRRVTSGRTGLVAATGSVEKAMFWRSPLNMGGASLLFPTDSEGVEVLVRPSVSVPDDPVSTATDSLAHNPSVHFRVTPRHHLFAA